MASRLEEGIENFEISFMRQADWFDPLRVPDSKVTLVGAGGIGSPTAIALSKLGVANIDVIDFDYVEPHNIPNQMYGTPHANELKVEALKTMCEAFGASEISVYAESVQDVFEHTPPKGVVITGLDNMDARNHIWEQVKNNPDVDLLIDARLGGQLINVFAIDPNNETHIQMYEQMAVFPQEESVEAPCTARGIIDVSFIVAALITRLTRRYLMGQSIESFVTFNQETLGIDTTKSEVFKVIEVIDSMTD